MRWRSNNFLVIGLLVSAWFSQAQTNAPSTAHTPTSTQEPSATDPFKEIFKSAIANIQNEFTRNNLPGAIGAAQDVIPIIVQRFQEDHPPKDTTVTFKASLLSEAEQNRIDQQVTAPSTQAGSTSAATKGSVPWLLGLAVEHGALTESTSGNTITYKGSIINTISAIQNKTYIDSYAKEKDYPVLKVLDKVSYALSFNASSGGGQSASSASNNTTASQNSTDTLSGFTFHVDLHNVRDPRNPHWDNDWAALTKTYQQNLTASINHLEAALHNTNAFKTWQANTAKAITDLHNKCSSTCTDDQIATALKPIVDEFNSSVISTDMLDRQIAVVAGDLKTFSIKRNGLLSRISGTQIFSIEYNFTNQSAMSLPKNTTATATQPNLSNINLIYDYPLIPGSADFTANASTTFFNSLPVGSHGGQVRDWRIAGQVEFGSGTLGNLGKTTVTLSGLFLDLLEQPLGAPVQVNGVDVSTTGRIGLFQGKYSVNLKNGLAVPISITYASRTQLVKESNVQGNIGISFNLDNLFSSLTK